MKLSSLNNIKHNNMTLKSPKKIEKNISFASNNNLSNAIEYSKFDSKNIVANYAPYLTFKGNPEEENVILAFIDEVLFEYKLSQILNLIMKTQYVKDRNPVFLASTIQGFSDNLASKNVLPEYNDTIAKMPDYYKKYNMTTVGEVVDFASCIYDNDVSKKCFENELTQALEIYSRLEDKSYIKKYPFLLASIYKNETNNENPDFSKLNTYPRFLEENKISTLNTLSSIEKLKNRFFMMSSSFNELETFEDVYNMIEYYFSVYDNKIELVGELLAKHKDAYKKSPEQFYNNYSQVVDFYFEESNAQSLGELDKYFDYFVQIGKLNSETKDRLSSNLPFLKLKKEETTSVEFFKKVDFFEFLHKNNISVKDLNVLYSTSIVKNGSDFKDIILLKDRLIYAIGDRNNKSTAENQKLYTIFAPVFVEVTRAKQDTDLLKTTLDVVDFYQIKSQKDIVELYNKFNPKQKTSELEPAELIEFIQLLSYGDETSKTLIKHKDYSGLKNQLETKQKAYLKTISDIQKYIKNNPDSFSGLSANDIYEKYVSKFPPKTEINSKLIEIAQSVNQDTQTKSKIRTFFFKLSDFNDFVNSNKIDFDLMVDKSYRSACLEILNSIGRITNGNTKARKEKINSLNESGFLINSKDELSDFVLKAKNANRLDELVNIIVNQKVTSLNELKDFIANYSSNTDDNAKVIDFLTLSNDCTLENCKFLLDKLQTFLDKSNIGIKLKADDLKYVDLDLIENIQSDVAFDGARFSKMANGLLTGKSDGAIVSNMKYAYWFRKSLFKTYIAEQMLEMSEKETVDSAIGDLLKALELDKESIAKKHPDIVEKKVFTNGKFELVVSKGLYKKYLEEEMPKEFVDLFNADFWNTTSKDKLKPVNFSFHAKLKFIARFGMDNGIDGLYSKENAEKLSNVIKMIYTTNPDEVVISADDSRLMFLFKDKIKKDETIEVILTPQGKIVTIFPKV